MTNFIGRHTFKNIDNAPSDSDGLIERTLLISPSQVVYPEVLVPLPINSREAQAAVHEALENHTTTITVMRKSDDKTLPLLNQIYSIGTEIALSEVPDTPDFVATVMAQGRRRVEIVELIKTEPTIVVRARPLEDIDPGPEHIESLTQAVIDLFEHSIELQDGISDDVVDYVLESQSAGAMCDFIAAVLTLKMEERQHILELQDVEQRLRQIAILLGKQLSFLEVRDEINSQIQDEMVRAQREVYLREQMRIIQNELGEEDIFQQELNELRDNIATAGLPAEAQTQALKELSRLNIMQPMSPETGVIRTYLDWLLSIPWNAASEDNLDLDHAEKTLDADHYGLPRVKERILEHIAVRKLAADKMKSPILCFVGPPGVGKTSLGKSIAHALGRQFVRMSLGGVRDEAEIRGHRRTYIGAMPGRILQTMRRAETINPVFMLDEIDKLSADYRGDPSAALLETLDPEQNNEFTDHYLEVPYDLSNVLFITTANDLSPISEALEDRMEIIEFSGYTEEEKLEIARRFLIPKQLEAHGLGDKNISFETKALQTIIREYTYEAGVRNLEREIANVCRKIARLAAQDKKHPKRLTPKRVSEYLGPPHHIQSKVNTVDSIGLVTGLVWTTGGGDVQIIEVSVLPGKGNMMLTGQLGDVLQESAQTAMSYMRARATDLDVPHDDFENYDIHIHMPEGAVPKEGPSAGITLATAIISAFTERKVRSSLAMTGELTLRGKVLPVGGIKEKVLAARRNRISEIILPAENEKDLVEIPKELLKDIKIHLVDDMQKVIDLMLLEAPEERRRDIEAQEREQAEQEQESIADRQVTTSS